MDAGSQGRRGLGNIQFSSVTQSCPTLCDPMDCSMPVHHQLLWSLLKLMSIESARPSRHLIFCHPILFLPSIFSSIKVFFNDLVLCIRCPNYWRFSFSIIPSNEYSELISFRTDWFDLLAVQGLSKCGYLSSKENPALRDKLLK